MALKATTKAKRIKLAQERISEHEAVTANIQAKLEGRKAELAVLKQDLKVLEMTRAVEDPATAE